MDGCRIFPHHHEGKKLGGDLTNETTRDGAKDGATQSAVETAYRRIRHLILTGEMRSGDKLLENHSPPPSVSPARRSAKL